MDRATQEKLDKLHDLSDMFTRKIDLEERRRQELKGQTEAYLARSMDMRRSMGGMNAGKENSTRVSKQVKVLENRLDKALVKFNVALAQNKELRNEIDNLRRERVVFDQIYNKLEKELHEKKMEMANIIEISNIAYEARGQAQNEIAALKAQADREQQAYEGEWKDLGNIIENDSRQHELRLDRAQGKTTLGKMTKDQEEALKKKGAQLSWVVGKNASKSQFQDQKVQSFEEAFEKVHKVTGLDKIDDIVTTFIQKEDMNYSLYNYLNELNQEVERLQEDITEINAEIDRYRGQGQNMDHRNTQMVTELEEKLAEEAAVEEAYEAKFQATQKTVAAVRQSIGPLFNKIGCNTPASQDVLGDEGVGEQNVLQYMGFIEARVNEIVNRYFAFISQGGQADAELRAAMGPPTPAGQTNISIYPPSTTNDESGGDSDDTEEELDDCPLTREELTVKTLMTISRRSDRSRVKSSRKK